VTIPNQKVSSKIKENNENEIQIPKSTKNYNNLINNVVGYLPTYKPEKVEKIINKSTNSTSNNDNSNVYPFQSTKKSEPNTKKIVAEHSKNNSNNGIYLF